MHRPTQPRQRTTMMPRRAFPFLLVLLWNYDLPAQTPYYQGKTIRLVAGTPAGSVYDSYARLMAQFLLRYIPGTPNIIVQNMTGLALMVEADYIYSNTTPSG